MSDCPVGQIELPFSDDLAAILGASVESVSRTLGELKRGKVLVRVAPRTYACHLGSHPC
jgi:CRP-like cAMP-binding protein